jgi:exo-1,4-beta-D-glucosaminidase
MKQNRLARTAFILLLLLSPFSWSETQTKMHPASPREALTLRDGWSLQSSCKVEKPGEVISTPKFAPAGWYTTSVPTTVVAALVKHKIYPDPDFGMNLRKLPGMDYPIGANFSNVPMQQDSPFMVPWWYRKEFTIPESFRRKTIWLDFGGINYRANIFLNGKKIAGKDQVAGAWRTYEFNITDAAHVGGTNVLAVEVYSPTD